MLVDIKIELSNIARENKKIAKEIAEFRNLIYEQKIELDSLKASIMETENKNTAMEAELFAARNKIHQRGRGRNRLRTIHEKAIPRSLWNWN